MLSAFFYLNTLPFQQPDDFQISHYRHEMLIGILTYPNVKKKRIENVIESLGNSFLFDPRYAIYFVDPPFDVGPALPNKTVLIKPKYFTNNQIFSKIYEEDGKKNYFRMSMLLASRFVNLVNFFLHHTNYAWLFRGTDDTLFNMKEFYKYMDELNSKYDPFSEPVIKCELMITDVGCCEHGGPGIIFSRKALENYEIRLYSFAENLFREEDWMYTNVILYNNISFNDVNSNRFLAYKPHRDWVLPPCPNDMEILSPVNKVVFWHNDPSMSLQMLSELSSYPPEYYFFRNFIHFETGMCDISLNEK